MMPRRVPWRACHRFSHDLVSTNSVPISRPGYHNVLEFCFVGLVAILPLRLSDSCLYRLTRHA